MKKVYIIPSVEAWQIATSELVCASIGLASEDASENNGTSDIEGAMLSRGNSVWDDDDY